MYAAPSPSNLSRRRHRQTSLRRWGRLLRSMILRALRRQEYATDMLEDEWRLVDHSDTWLDAQGAAELRPAPGNRQYVNKKPTDSEDDDEPNQMMLPSDMILAWDPAFRSHLEVYAADEAKLKHDFGKAFKKLTELGCPFAQS